VADVHKHIMSIKHFISIIYQYIDFYSCLDICSHCSMLCIVKVIRIFWSSSQCICDQVLDVLPHQVFMINVNSYPTRFSSILNRRNPHLPVFGLLYLQNNYILVFFLSLLGFLNSFMTYLTTLMISMVM
jgi:hypothetical protein